jgi:hypothetical protein
MLSAVRRAPGSLTRVLSSTSTATRVVGRLVPKTSLPTRNTPQIACTARQLHSTTRWLRDARAAASVESDAPAENQDRDNAPTSSNPIHDAKEAPLTRFQELAERNLVDEAVIRPITNDMNITTMTHVQSLTINETLKGVDV